MPQLTKYSRGSNCENFQIVAKTCNFTFRLGVSSKLKSITQNLKLLCSAAMTENMQRERAPKLINLPD
jgi:hypothetical protein